MHSKIYICQYRQEYRPDFVLVRYDPKAGRVKYDGWEDVLVPIEVKRTTGKMQPPRPYGTKGAKVENPREILIVEGKGSTLNGRQQLGGYAAAILSATALKRHTIGMMINFTQFELWYYDRAGTIGSATVDFSNDFALLLAIVLAFGHGTSHTFGYEPELVPDRLEYRTRFQGIIIDDIQSRRTSTNAVRPSSNVMNRDSVEITSENIACPDTRRRHPYEGGLEDLPPPRVLFGGGTTAYRCATNGSNNVMVVKLSWQSPGRRSEVDFLEMARPIQGIPTLWGRRDISELSRGLRGRLEEHVAEIYKLPPFGRRNMILRAIVVKPLCVPLYSVPDLCIFMKAFRSLLRGRFDNLNPSLHMFSAHHAVHQHIMIFMR